ncbi:hypothetical protein DVH24_020383 [Malus domestica]|uniref:Uncharacterized protein n=1 Tax=Malus domestica TaxID=3750 RepID=A0A498J791_MALDO|nr:hypothetical protein DVH24_020383 [Malus domestica]
MAMRQHSRKYTCVLSWDDADKRLAQPWEATLPSSARKALYGEVFGLIANKTLRGNGFLEVLGFTFSCSLGLDFPLDLCSFRPIEVKRTLC